MGLDADLGTAYAKSQMAAHAPLPLEGRVFISVNQSDKEKIVDIAKELAELGFELICTEGTSKVLTQAGLKVREIKKIERGTSQYS